MAMKGTSPPKELICVIRGSWNKGASSNELSSGIHITGELQSRYIEFAKTHEIIDVQALNQSIGYEIVLVVRYKP